MHNKATTLCACCSLTCCLAMPQHQQPPRRSLPYDRAAALDENPVYPYRHIFVYLHPGCIVAAPARTTGKNGKKYAAATSK